jgi:DNA-directed RNA polymerase specialized sigma24 family protein
MKRKSGAEWVCEHGCDQAYYIKKNGGYCPHLEALIGPVSASKSKLVLSGEPDRFQTLLTPEEEWERWEQLLKTEALPEEPLIDDEELMRRQLRRAGLKSRKVEVVVDRVVRGKTFSEIAIDRGYSEASAASRAYADAMDQLRKRGYGEKT